MRRAQGSHIVSEDARNRRTIQHIQCRLGARMRDTTSPRSQSPCNCGHGFVVSRIRGPVRYCVCCMGRQLQRFGRIKWRGMASMATRCVATQPKPRSKCTRQVRCESIRCPSGPTPAPPKSRLTSHGAVVVGICGARMSGQMGIACIAKAAALKHMASAEKNATKPRRENRHEPHAKRAMPKTSMHTDTQDECIHMRMTTKPSMHAHTCA